MTPTLESALAGLPAKPRVHELSKRIGISNKELLAALAERGLTISSASSSVPLAVARAVIGALLGAAAETDGAVSEEAAAPPDEDGSPARSSEIPGDSPGRAGHAINPLFLPPAEFQSGASPQVEGDGGEKSPDADGGQPARSGSSRRRRGRSSGGRRPAAGDTAEPPGSFEAAGEDAAVSGETRQAPPVTDGATPSDGSATDRTEQGATDRTEQGATDRSEQGATDRSEQVAAVDTDEESAAPGRRRRRGRRGRGRISDTDERSDGDADSAPVTDSHAPTAVESPGTAAEEAAQPEEGDESDGSDDESDSDAGQQGSAGNRRRRRRRRRSTGDQTPREDDPDNTVVHVREPRLSQASSGGSSAPSNEVQGVRGSTRLEAKRQRRRDSRDSSRRRPQILTEAEFLARRESVERVMAVRQRGGLAQVALLEDGILVEHFVSQTGSDSMIGSVFLGKVQNVLPSMEAAFVDIGRGRNAVIYAGEVNWDAAGLNGKARRIETALSSGDTILAQVSKDPVGHKGARLTTQISLPGRFVVYVPGGGATGISRKLPDTERRRLKLIMDRIVPEDAGVIIRTAAEGIAEEELARDVERLTAQWAEISRRASEKTSAPTQLYAEPGTLIKVVRDLFNSDITRLVVDGDEAYQPVAEYVTSVAPELADRLVRYEGGGPNDPDVFAAYRIDEQIAKALERKVHLPSGGSLVIDRTEAMTVVDVNTGKYTGSGGNLEETVTKNNLEAAEEMVRQLRLRDIGGIIVIDFIDMVLESNRELVLRRLTEALGRDRTRHQVAEVTSLGLVQMTRKRMGTGLVEAFSEPCPHCGGRGLVLHDLPVVAAAIEDGGPERRSGKSRRGRGRDTDRVEDIVVPRVVEVPAGRRPDPRGPKPPWRRAQEHDGVATDQSTNGGSGRVDDLRTPVTTGSGADEIDWIEAAARAGIAAAEDADEDGFEAGQPGTDDQDSAGRAGEPEHDGPGSGVAAEPAPIEPVEGAEIVVTVDLGHDDAPADVIDAAAAGAEEAPSQPAPERRRRGRRSAGRPAGAPPAAQPVDIVVKEQPVQIAPEPTQQHATNGHDDRAGHDGGDGPSGNGEQLPAAPVTPPRRRRAASRPAGPAAGATAADPVVVGVPVDQPAG